MATWQPRWINPKILATAVVILAVVIGVALYIWTRTILAGILGFAVGGIGAAAGAWVVYETESQIFSRHRQR